MRAVVGIVLLVLAGCGGSAASAPPSAEPDVTGTATQVSTFEPVTTNCVTPPADPDASVSSDDPPFCTSEDDDNLGSVLVEEDPGSDAGDTKIVFRVVVDTALLRETDDGYEPGTFADLVEGATVSAWTDGPIAESYPAQATASAIVVHGS